MADLAEKGLMPAGDPAVAERADHDSPCLDECQPPAARSHLACP